MMNRTRPKSAWAGFKSGMTSIGGGLAGAAAAVVACTVDGVNQSNAQAQQQGKQKAGVGRKLVGGLKGLGVGVAVGAVGYYLGLERKHYRVRYIRFLYIIDS